MRSRLLLAPVLVFVVGVDGMIGCSCEEILDQTPKPVAVLVFQDQLTPPADNLDIGLPATAIGSPVVARFAIENRGNAPLNVSDIVLASDPVLCPSPSGSFTIVSPAQLAGAARSAVVAAGATAQVEVQFAATSGQPSCAVVEVRGNDVVSPVLKARISGQGDAPQLCVDRGIVDFGTVFVGDRKEETLTLSSCGTRPFELNGSTLNAMFPEPFELVTPITAGSVDVGRDVVLTVAFDPEAPGSFTGANSGTIDLDTDLDGAFRLQLVGIAQLPPACRIQVVPELVQFGSVGATRSSTQSVFVRNIGELDCTFTSAVVVSGAPFSRELVSLTDNSTLTPQQIGELRVTYAPTQFVGPESDILRVTTSDPVRAVIDVPLQGTSVELQPCFLEAVPTAVNFGFQTLRRSKETEVILRNVGTETCVVTTADITTGVPEFTIIEPPFTALADNLPPIIANLFPFGAIVSAGSEISFIVGFRPEQAGLRLGNYRFNYKELGIGNPSQTIDVPANGTGVAPCVEIVPADVDFGTLATGASANRDVSIRNCGGADLVIRGVGLRSGSHPDFSMPTAPPLPATIAPGATVPVTVRAAPTTNGVALAGAAMFGTLDIMSDDVTNGVLLRANTNGACVNGLVCSPRTLEFGDVLLGEDLVRSVVCNNPTTSPIALTPAIAAPFTLMSPPTTVPAGGQAIVRVRFTPTTTTQATQPLRIGANDCSGATISVTVRGRGADDELPACPVNPTFDPQLKWDWNGSTAVNTPRSHEVWVTPLVSRLGDTNNDGFVTRDDMPRVVFVSFDRSKVSSPLALQESINDPVPAELRAIDGATGTEVWTTVTRVGNDDNAHAVQSAGTPAIADLDGDGKVEIIAQKYILLPGVETLPGGPKINGKFARGFLIAFNFDGSFKWVSDEWTRRSEEIEDGGAPAVGDVDGDGFAEIALGDHLFDHTGRLLWRGDGTKIGSTGHGPTSVLADVDGQAGLELICGSRVYRKDGSILWDRADLEDGHVALADVDGNGSNEIVLRGSKIHVLNGATGASLVTPFIPPTRPSMARECQRPTQTPGEDEDDPCSIIPTNPAILNFDGGNDLEIFTSNQELITGYKLVGGQLQEIFRKDIYDGSGASGPAGFDFDGDGDEELVYADENTLRTWTQGGTQTFAGSRESVTIFEYAVIADIDLDGHAEMLVASNSPFVPLAVGGVRAYANRGVSWAQARSIWNQHAYVESIISELGVPLFESTPTPLPGFRNARARCVPN